MITEIQRDNTKIPGKNPSGRGSKQCREKIQNGYKLGLIVAICAPSLMREVFFRILSGGPALQQTLV
jgi:hypothetical protein